MGGHGQSANNIRQLEELAGKKTAIHKIHPLAKVLVTVFYLVAAVSFDKYDLDGLLPLIIYQAVIIPLAEIPPTVVMQRILAAAPFIVGIGAFNPLCDRSPAVILPQFQITGGWVSFLSILLKGVLAVSAATILVATTSLPAIAAALRTLGIPKIFVNQLLLTYRYIAVLGEEAGRMSRAYALRSGGKRGIAAAYWGTFAGQLLTRALDRAQGVYRSMCCRGFTGDYEVGGRGKMGTRDLAYAAGWIIYIAAVRCFEVPEILGSLMAGVRQ